MNSAVLLQRAVYAEGIHPFPRTTIVGTYQSFEALFERTHDAAVTVTITLRVSPDNGKTWLPWAQAVCPGGESINPMTGQPATHAGVAASWSGEGGAPVRVVDALLGGEIEVAGGSIETSVTATGQ